MSKLDLTLEDFQKLAEEMGKATREAIERAVSPLRDRIAEGVERLNGVTKTNRRDQSSATDKHTA